MLSLCEVLLESAKNSGRDTTEAYSHGGHREHREIIMSLCALCALRWLFNHMKTAVIAFTMKQSKFES
jgi:hypothetical protein